MVNKMLMKKSTLQPVSRKTPTGGRIMAKMILMMSLQHTMSAPVLTW